MLKVFRLEGLEFEFDDQKLLLQEAIWWERMTGCTARQIQISWQQGGALGIGAWLMLAARRNGHHMKWESIQNIDLGGDDLDLETIQPEAPVSEEDETPDPPVTSVETPPHPKATKPQAGKSAQRSRTK